MADAIDDAVNSPAPPQSMTTAEGTVQQQPISELIKGDQYQAAKKATARGFSFGGARMAQAVGPPQCDATPSGSDTGGGGF
jgi:hypothetical protein